MARHSAVLVAALLAMAGHGAVAENLEACFGGNDAICNIWSDMDDVCSEKLGKGDKQDYDAWYACLCGTGWLSVLQACDDCEAANGIGAAVTETLFSSDCSSQGLTIAPIPSSVASRVSGFTATLTGDSGDAVTSILSSASASAAATDNPFSFTPALTVSPNQPTPTRPASGGQDGPRGPMALNDGGRVRVPLVVVGMGAATAAAFGWGMLRMML